MIDPGSVASLVEERRDTVCRIDELLMRYLERHQPIQLSVITQLHATEGASTQNLTDFIAPQFRRHGLFIIHRALRASANIHCFG